MKIDKAIEIQTRMLKARQRTGLRSRIAALELGIEALKRVKSERTMDDFSDRSALPGETEE